MTWAMAFFCALDPSPLRVPVTAPAAAPLVAAALEEVSAAAVVPAAEEEVVLLSEPQAVSARAPTTAIPARRPVRVIIVMSVLRVDVSRRRPGTRAANVGSGHDVTTQEW